MTINSEGVCAHKLPDYAGRIVSMMEYGGTVLVACEYAGFILDKNTGYFLPVTFVYDRNNNVD